MLRLRPLLVLAVLLLPLPAQPPGLEAVESLITAESLRGPIEFLASDLLEGRGVGSRGDELSRLYLESQFRFLGLRGGAAGESFVQPVPIVGTTAKVTETLRARSGDQEHAFGGPEDFAVTATRPVPATAWRDAELVFVGYGITAPEQQWDDFKDVDVTGKVLLVMNNDPSSDPALFAGETRLYYGRWTYKFEEAARRGAAGAIVIHTEPSAGYPFQVIQAGHEQERFDLPAEPGAPACEIEAWCSDEAAQRLAALGGRDLDALRAAAERRDFRPVSLGVTVSLATGNTVRTLESGNVLAVLPGSDPVLGPEVVVVTAHFDHLGIGRPRDGDAIYNGALDNASGVSAMLNLARAAAALPLPPRRSLLFAAVTAEESGLLGSLHLARNLPVPRERVIANLNIDGINIWGPTEDVGFIGHGKNSLTELAEEVARRRGRTLTPDKDLDKGYFYRSDHFNFARIGVPCAYFKAGGDFLENRASRRRVKAAYTTTLYHTPRDQFDERWNLEGGAQDTRFTLECLLRIANDEAPPTWTPGDEFEGRR
jgi:Zn-dependent M28 family amino/carboxypeptidase